MTLRRFLGRVLLETSFVCRWKGLRLPETLRSIPEGPQPLPGNVGNEKNKRRKTHKNKIFSGLPRDFGRRSCSLFFCRIRNDPKNTSTNILAPTQSRGESPKLVYVYMCFLSLRTSLLVDLKSNPRVPQKLPQISTVVI